MDLQWMRMVVGEARSKSSILIVSLDVGPFESLEMIGPLYCIVSEHLLIREDTTGTYCIGMAGESSTR